jgi:hypothetical protein
MPHLWPIIYFFGKGCLKLMAINCRIHEKIGIKGERWEFENQNIDKENEF